MCDDYVESIGCVKRQFSTDEEVKRFTAQMSFDNGEYLVVYFGCDITGEKAYKEFYVAGKK